MNECERYDGIIQDWERNRPIYEQRIGQYEDSIKGLKEQIEQLIMERINDRPHAEIYNSMISKREEQIVELEKKITDCRIYDKVSREKQSELKNTAAIIDEILTAGQLTDAQLRMFVNRVRVHENADKSLDIIP